MGNTLIPHFEQWQPLVDQQDSAADAALMDSMFSASPGAGPRAGQDVSGGAARQALQRQTRMTMQNTVQCSQQAQADAGQAALTTQDATLDTTTQTNLLMGAQREETGLEDNLVGQMAMADDDQAEMQDTSLQQFANAFFTLGTEGAGNRAVEQSRRTLQDRERLRKREAAAPQVLVRVPPKEGAARS